MSRYLPCQAETLRLNASLRELCASFGLNHQDYILELDEDDE